MVQMQLKQFQQISSQNPVHTNNCSCLAVIPSKIRSSSVANQTLFVVLGHILWNVMLYHLNTIQDPELFKCQLTKFMLSIPDILPIKGYTPLCSTGK